MKVLATVVKKELLEYLRNFSLIWVPTVFILLAIMDPLTTYYTPVILDAVGGLPEGTVFEFPEIVASEAFMMSFTQLSAFGILIVVLLTMNTIAGERKSGVSELILVKPIKVTTYITGKWLAKLILFLSSIILALLTSCYYVNILFGHISISDWAWSVLFYGTWIMFVISLTVFYNTTFKAPGAVAGSAIGTLIAMTIFNTIFAHRLPWFPNNLSSHIAQMVASGTISTDLWATAGIIVGLSGLLLIASFAAFSKKEWL
ncbi:ABC-2 type transport system permease protein [Amphibacillus marinus]|uniref:ABC-2 type transport system permease protein n=1 Tax=Amphibacillus marinus TaxID=872970 RepID=A0A1H8RGU7_9BACI|nr:ABC transporter permease subunit [Amphibacillus marinus]SEO65586.1 ABC-2 type transport system permease protein [Amphibacillus marinus]